MLAYCEYKKVKCCILWNKINQCQYDVFFLMKWIEHVTYVSFKYVFIVCLPDLNFICLSYVLYSMLQGRG